MSEWKPSPRVAAVHDLSGFGRCALSVVMPVLSALGAQACPLPTAVLSTHTGGYDQIASRDLTDFMREALAHWARLGIAFDAVYSGYLGSVSQVDMVRGLIRAQRSAGVRLAVVDPAMGDDGRLYSAVDSSMPEAMRALCAEADLITPNLTEAHMLTRAPYSAAPRKPAEVAALLSSLLRLGCGQALVTGMPMEDGKFANVCMRAGEDGFWLCNYDVVPASYPGTGDLFASVLTGALLGGRRLSEAMAVATCFTHKAVALTARLGTPPREGVQFERLLGEIDRADDFFSRFRFC